MKKLLLLIPFLFACEKEEPQPTQNATCACTITKQQLGAGGSWTTISTTAPFSDFCSKDGMIEYEPIYRYIWICQ